MSRQTANSVPVSFAAKAYGKDPSWVRAGIITGYLPIGTATRNGKQVTSIDEMDSKYGRINYYISPRLLYEETGVRWNKDDMDENLSYRNKELLYFCRQYPFWKAQFDSLASGEQPRPDKMIFGKNPGGKSDITPSRAIARTYYKERMNMVEDAAKGFESEFIFEYATSDVSMTDVIARHGLSPVKFTASLMKFFDILGRKRE